MSSDSNIKPGTGKGGVLIIEDDPIIAAHLSILLQENGYDLVGVADEFETALVIAERTRPKVALVDVHLMGTIDGVTVGRELSSRFDTALVFVTANLDIAVKGMEDMRAEFVGKPFGDEEILAGLRRAFAAIG
jgi:DNA-binding response OmpR family regulator